jgi:glyoxylase-like metal-dependent hydrolase (beta-lactamase superfamily II)
MNALFQEGGIRVFERGWLSSNNVLLASGSAGEAILVDTGYATHAEQTVALVRSALKGRSLDRVINTHLHSDHCGANHALQQAFGCAVDVPSGEAHKVDAWDQDALTYHATGQLCPRFHRTGSITAGDELVHGNSHWQVLAAPGHDPESVVLYEPDLQVLISADALWANGFGVVFPELDGEPGFDDVKRTLDMLAGLRVRWVIPGHGPPFDDFEPAITRAFKRLQGLAADPAKHARHAAKVLIKFHLLEVHSCTTDQLSQWLDRVPYVETTRRAHFAGLGMQAWRADLMSELVGSGALRIDGTLVRNI